ncbi:MAG: hypothetical protein ACOCX2_10845 [Armatimonadota bacterium]
MASLQSAALSSLMIIVAACFASAAEHPIYTNVDPAKAEEYEAAVERVMAMSEDEMLGFMPDLPYIGMCNCPQCYGGAQGRNIFSWSVDRPNQLVCRHCDLVIDLPDERFPETERLVGENALGEEVAVPYYLNEETGERHYLTGNLWMYHRRWVTNQVTALAEAWQATRKPEYARRVALVLDKVATLYPHWPAIHNRSVNRVRFCDSQEPPYPWDSGRWGNFHNEIPRPMLTAYDLIYDSDAFETLSQERGYDVRARIEDDFFRATYRAAELSPYKVSNVVGYDITSAAMMGRVLEEPDMVHQAFGWMLKNLDEGFFYDGTWHESPSYHYMTLGGLRKAFSVIEGYSDPPGYVHEETGQRFDDLDPLAVAPFWATVQDAFKKIGHPDGTSAVVHDTWAGEERAAPREATVSTLLPGYGHASLGRGSAAHQMQAQLHFSGAYGHAHRDTLGMTLWAKEREMLSDVGYTWTDIRWWTVSSISHNLVVIDSEEQQGRPSDGDLLAFFPGEDDLDVSVVEADGRRAYANIEDLDMYRRLLVLVPVSDEDAYMVDISRTAGGSLHDWMLHGSADEDMTAECDLTLSDAGADFAGEEPSQSYEVWRNVRHAGAEDGFAVTFACADEPERGVRTHLLGAAPTDVYLGETPSVRRAGVGSRGDNRRTMDYWMPHLAARRTGEAPLQSLFAAVHEPFLGEAFIDSVSAVEVTPADSNCVALQVTSGAISDTIISTLDEAPYHRRTVGDITLSGRLGIVRRVNGEVTGTWLFEGTELTVDGEGISDATAKLVGAIDGAVRVADGAEHDALLTSADLPPGEDLRGSWLIMTHGNGFRHGYEIDRIEEVDGRTAIVLAADHGLRIDGETTTEVYFPQRTIEGTNTFEIPLRTARTQN